MYIINIERGSTVREGKGKQGEEFGLAIMAHSTRGRKSNSGLDSYTLGQSSCVFFHSC